MGATPFTEIAPKQESFILTTADAPRLRQVLHIKIA
jgi:hypothetical protein